VRTYIQNLPVEAGTRLARIHDKRLAFELTQ
jgi:hypothetical protein